MADYKNINIRNKRATFDYEIIEEWIAGIVLVGTEIKSVRLGKASITDSYCYFDKGELWIRGVNIAEYGWGTCNNHVPRRDRKLLLNRKELNKIQRALQDRGLTVVGLRLFLNGVQRNFLKRMLRKLLLSPRRGANALMRNASVHGFNQDLQPSIRTSPEISRLMIWTLLIWDVSFRVLT